MSTTESHPENQAQVDPNAVNITINDAPIVARKGEMIIAAADRTDDFIPRFCYHPRMKPVGMCRQCLVEIDTPRGPMMVVSCMTPVTEGQVVRTATDQVKRAQEGMIELLLANHPLDCPVCDKGGECPLQDQAFSHGPGESRYVEEKRHYEKPIPISDLVFLDRERCILCDRCTRFASDVAGDPLISFTHRGNNTQVLTFPDEPFASYFSGNTVQICPVGALTAQPYRFKARPWDLEQRESTCTSCSVGCRIVVQSSRDEVLRYQGVDSDPVNWGWLCDRGRFNFQSVNSPDRLTTPLIRRGDNLEETSWSEALEVVARTLRMASGSSVAILGGARGTNEDAYAWAQLADALGISMRDAQMDDGLPARIFSYPGATIGSTCASHTVVLMSPDIKEELPVLYLRLRDAVQNKGVKIIELSTHDTGMTPYTWKSLRFEPGHSAEAVRAMLNDTDVASQIASGDITVVAGRGNLAENSELAMAGVDALLSAVPNAKVLPVLRRGNVRGALALGLAPRSGLDAANILEASANGKVDCLILLGADPMTDVPDTDLARRGIAGARFVVSVDTTLSTSTQHADVVLPAAAFAEKAGTTTNLEGRVTDVTQQITASGTSRPDWMIAVELAYMLDHDLGVMSLEEVQQHLKKDMPAFAAVATSVQVRRDGVVISLPLTSESAATPAVAEKKSYEFRLIVGRKMYDNAVSTATSPSLTNLAPGAVAFVHPLDLERVGTHEGATVRIGNDASTVVLPIHAAEWVSRSTVFVPFNQPGVDVRELIRHGQSVTDVRIETMS
jgi:NADH-quinone oxidoreductase subunit G